MEVGPFKEAIRMVSASGVGDGTGSGMGGGVVPQAARVNTSVSNKRMDRVRFI